MRFQIIFFTTIFTLFLGACSSSETVNNSAKSNVANKTANIASSNANNPLAATRASEAPTTNNAPTLSPVIQAYYEALKTKNEAALRKVYSRESLKSLEADMKEEKKTSLVEYLIDSEGVPDKPFEVRNEQVHGDSASAEVRGGNYPNGNIINFVKENGEWKITTESQEVQSVKQSAANSNTAK
ncbi:MAG: nuclear transport factor 2 family protein [Acidobacteriota bacterium]|nr:nuclear transport factor 2 family protein [Acidobacteriota bacterium]